VSHATTLCYGLASQNRKMAASSELRYRVSNSNSAWHPPQTVIPDRLQIQFL